MDVDEKNVGNAEDENIKHEEIYIKEETLNDDETNKIDNYTNKIDGQDGKVSRRKRRAVKEIMKEEPYSSEDDEIMETIKQVSHRKRRAVKQIIKGELYSSEDDEIIENTEQGFGLKDEIDHDIVKEELSYSSHEEDNVKSRRKDLAVNSACTASSDEQPINTDPLPSTSRGRLKSPLQERFMAEDLDCELLIDLIEERACLWDLHIEAYKDKQKKANAWAEIGEKMVENFKNKSEHEKNETCRNFQTKWKSIRDRYARTRKECPSGSGKKNKKPYVYQERLSFLSKMYENRATSSSLFQESNEIDRAEEGCTTQANEPKQNTQKYSRKNKRDQIEDKRIGFIDASGNKQSNDFVKFCESLYPNMSSFTEEEMFEVKSDLLYSVRKIKERKKRKNEIASRQSTVSGQDTL